MTHAETRATALEEFENGSYRRWLRLSVERMAYTHRGRFAFLVGVLMLVISRQDILLTQETPQATIFVSGRYLPEAIGELLSGGLMLVVVLLAGIVVLLILDLYESEVGLVVETADDYTPPPPIHERREEEDEA